MKLAFIIILFTVLSCFSAKAQKILPQIWVKKEVDSLQAKKVDTIIYYHKYCSECFVKSSDTACANLNSDYTEIFSVLLYKHDGMFHALYYNCKLPAYDKMLPSAASAGCFLSLIPTLIQRDKYIRSLYRQKKFLGPYFSDSGYTEAVLYFKHQKYTVGLQWAQQFGDYKFWKRYFWISKEVHLFKLLDSDLFPRY